MIALSQTAHPPLILWNASASVSIGLYVVRRVPPQRGQLAVVQLTKELARYAHSRGYLTRTGLLLKPVAAIEGDRVCRSGRLVFIGRRIAARARSREKFGKPLPAWSGCRKLGLGELFVLAPTPWSFDSRYLGVIRAEQVIGEAK